MSKEGGVRTRVYKQDHVQAKVLPGRRVVPPDGLPQEATHEAMQGWRAGKNRSELAARTSLPCKEERRKRYRGENS